ncbi:MAG: hypothetical protein PHX21_10680 [bacterium]|nr:hypothetical protein [bacterium]
MRKYLLCTLLFCVNLYGQWTKTFGGADYDYGNSVQQTSDGGFIIAGWTNSFGIGGDVYLIRTNSSGNTLWAKTFGGTKSDVGKSVQQTQDGGFIVAGYTESFGKGSFDFYLIRTNSSGDTLWTRTFGGTNNDQGTSVQQTSDGGFIIAGVTSSFGAGYQDVYLIRTNSSGDTLWTKTFGGTKSDQGTSVQQTQDSGFIIVGTTSSFGTSGDVYLIRTNSLGDTVWTRTFGGDNYDRGASVQQAFDGGFIITGETNSFGTGDRDVYLIRTNPLGDTLWTKTYGGSKDDYGNSVQPTQDGGFIIVGSTYSFGTGTPGSSNVYLIRANPLGDTLWTKTFGGTLGDMGNSVRQTSDGGFIITGETYSFGINVPGSSNVYLIKTNSSGNISIAKEVSAGQNSKLKTNQNTLTNSATIKISNAKFFEVFGSLCQKGKEVLSSEAPVITNFVEDILMATMNDEKLLKDRNTIFNSLDNLDSLNGLNYINNVQQVMIKYETIYKEMHNVMDSVVGEMSKYIPPTKAKNACNLVIDLFKISSEKYKSIDSALFAMGIDSSLIRNYKPGNGTTKLLMQTEYDGICFALNNGSGSYPEEKIKLAGLMAKEIEHLRKNIYQNQDKETIELLFDVISKGFKRAVEGQ